VTIASSTWQKVCDLKNYMGLDTGLTVSRPAYVRAHTVSYKKTIAGHKALKNDNDNVNDNVLDLWVVAMKFACTLTSQVNRIKKQCFPWQR
jgi:hypothetical protein